MLFNTTHFFIFLAVVLALFYSSPRALRKYILLAASYFFYGSWNYKFIALLLTLTAIDYTAGIWLEKVPPGPRRKAVLILSLCANLGFLGFFKYYNFLASNLALADAASPRIRSFWISCCRWASASTRFRACRTWWMCIAASRRPCAIRSTTRCSSASSRNWWPGRSCARAISFTIFGTGSRPSAEDVSRGVLLMALGLTKKMAFADQFAKVANDYFRNVAGNPGMLTAWSGVLAFGMQIYFDFSGYTDMAIGMAKLLGFHFPGQLPAAVPGIQHHGLLAALAHFAFDVAARLSVHPAGRQPARALDDLSQPDAHHAAGRAVARRELELRDLGRLSWRAAQRSSASFAATGKPREDWNWLYPVKALVTFGLVMIGWVFFRAADLPQSLQVLGQMFHGAAGHLLFANWHIELILIALVLAMLEEKLEWFERLPNAPALAYASALALMFFCHRSVWRDRCFDSIRVLSVLVWLVLLQSPS